MWSFCVCVCLLLDIFFLTVFIWELVSLSMCSVVQPASPQLLDLLTAPLLHINHEEQLYLWVRSSWRNRAQTAQRALACASAHVCGSVSASVYVTCQPGCHDGDSSWKSPLCCCSLKGLIVETWKQKKTKIYGASLVINHTQSSLAFLCLFTSIVFHQHLLFSIFLQLLFPLCRTHRHACALWHRTKDWC